MDYFQTVKSLPLPQYGLHDWDPNSGITLEEWAQGLADKGWHTWAGSGGTWTIINGRRVYRVHLRREAHFLHEEVWEMRRKAAGRR